MLYPQNGDRIVAIDFVTSLHPVYIQKFIPRRFMHSLVSYVKFIEREREAYKVHGKWIFHIQRTKNTDERVCGMLCETEKCFASVDRSWRLDCVVR